MKFDFFGLIFIKTSVFLLFIVLDMKNCLSFYISDSCRWFNTHCFRSTVASWQETGRYLSLYLCAPFLHDIFSWLFEIFSGIGTGVWSSGYEICKWWIWLYRQFIWISENGFKFTMFTWAYALWKVNFVISHSFYIHCTDLFFRRVFLLKFALFTSNVYFYIFNFVFFCSHIINGLAFSSNGEKLLVASGHAQIRIIDRQGKQWAETVRGKLTKQLWSTFQYLKLFWFWKLFIFCLSQ